MRNFSSFSSKSTLKVSTAKKNQQLFLTLWLGIATQVESLQLNLNFAWKQIQLILQKMIVNT